jgi:protein-S-isoprenylcysteine O-methyltransferase Ste14
MHKPPIFVFPEAIIFWIAFIWFFYLEIQHSLSVPKGSLPQQDAGTFRLIDVGSQIALYLAFASSFLPWLNIPYPRLSLIVGIGLLIVGSVFRRYCIRTLGKYFTAEVLVTADQPVIEAGPYHLIRHPGYAAGFVVYLRIGLALASWLSLVIFLIEVCVVYHPRIRAEEKALLETIGEPYRAYMAHTKRFIPYIF